MKCQRDKFNLQRKYAYLNCAYMSPLLKKVENAGIKGIKSKRKPFHISPEDFFQDSETLRLLFSKLVNNSEPKRVCIIPSVSYGIANVTKNLPIEKGKILLVEGQFPSNVYPWLKLEERGFKISFINAPEASKVGASWNEKIIDSRDKETMVLAMGHVHWADGTLFDLKAIRKKLDDVGALLIIDGTQSVGALPFDIQEIKPDALICAGYKWLMGPYSMGLAYYGERFDNGSPIEENWINRKNSENFSGLVEYESTYQDLALRYEVGEHSNFILLPMLNQALKQVLKWTPEAIQFYCKQLMSKPIEAIEELGYLVEDPQYRSSHLLGIRWKENMDKSMVIKSLKRNRVSVSIRGNAIRVSPHVYNDEMDVRKLVKALKEPILAS